MSKREDFETIEDAMQFIKDSPNFSGIVYLKLQIMKQIPKFLIGKNEVFSNNKPIDYLEISLEVKGGNILSSEIKQIHKQK